MLTHVMLMFFSCYGQLSLSEKLSSSSIVDIVILEHDLPSEKPVFQSHSVKLFDVANQGHDYILNSLQTWEYPIGDPVQILN